MSSFGTEDVLSKVKTLRTQGMSYRQIEKETGISKTKVGTMLAISEKEADTFLSELPKPKIELKPKDQKKVEKLMESLKEPPKDTASMDPAKKVESMEVGDLINEMKKAQKQLEPGAKEPVMRTTRARATKPAPEDNSELISKISLIVNSDKGMLNEYFKPDKEGYLKSLLKMKEQALSSQLKMLETAKIAETSVPLLYNTLAMASLAVENITQRVFSMQTQGYAKVLQQQSNEIRTCLREIAIDNADKLKAFQSPTARLATILSMSLIQLDMINRSGPGSKQANVPAPASAPAPAQAQHPEQSATSEPEAPPAVQSERRRNKVLDEYSDL